MIRRYSPDTVLIALAGSVLLLGLAAESLAGTDKIMKEVRETIETTREYTVQQKETFQQKAQEELMAIQRQISVFQDKVRDVSAATRADLQGVLNGLERQKETAKEQLNAMRAATDQKWSAIRSGVDTALDEIKNSYRKALLRLP